MPGRTEEENATNPDSCAEEIARCRSEAFLPGQALLKFHNVACLLMLYQGFKSPPPPPRSLKQVGDSSKILCFPNTFFRDQNSKFQIGLNTFYNPPHSCWSSNGVK